MAQKRSRPKATAARRNAGVAVQRSGEMEYERGPGSKFELAGRGLTAGGGPTRTRSQRRRSNRARSQGFLAGLGIYADAARESEQRV